YAAARESAAVVALSERGVLVASGPQRLKFLHNMLSNDVEGRKPGQGCLAALMDVKGRQLAWMRVLITADSVLLERKADRLPPVEQVLLHYKVGAPVRFALKPTAILGLVGPKGRDALARAGAEMPELAPESYVAVTIAGQPALVARASDLPAQSHVLH